MSEWISVKDRFPDYQEIVLVINRDGEMAVCKFQKTEFEYFFMLFNTSYQIINVTHWQSLPEPPKD